MKERNEFPLPLERALRDARINRIVEGTTDIMHLFLTREALDGHMKNAKPLFSRSTNGEKAQALLKGHYKIHVCTQRANICKTCDTCQKNIIKLGC